MLRSILVISGIVSFLYFLNPALAPRLSESSDKVLGVKSMNQAANRQSVYTAVLAYCLDKGELPTNLNQLFESELSSERKMDLNGLYRLKSSNTNSCEFSLEAI